MDTFISKSAMQKIRVPTSKGHGSHARFIRFCRMLEMASNDGKYMTIYEMCRTMELQGFSMYRSTCYRYIHEMLLAGYRFKTVQEQKRVLYILET